MVALSKDDFIELQKQLHRRDPKRNSKSYLAQTVLTIKADFLRSRSSADTMAYASLFDAAPNDNLIPNLVFNTTHDHSPIPSDALGTDEDDDMDAYAMDVGPDPTSLAESQSYIQEDTNYLSTGDTAIFPCTIRYIDLVTLGLKHFTRTPQLIFLREEWGNMVNLFNKREKGIRGGAVFTGQPGIGECLVLVL